MPAGTATEDCPICRGLGYVRRDLPVGHPGFGRLQPCTCRLQQLAQQQAERLRGWGNLRYLEHLTFDSFVPDGHGLPVDKRQNLRHAYELALAFANNPRGWLVLKGGYGCGKTHLAAAIANACVKQGRAVVFTTVPDLLDHLRATFGPSSSVGYDEHFDAVRNAPVLILDDLGAESATHWTQEKLFQILNYRQTARLPTVITTNCEPEQFDPRLRSRLDDTNLVENVPILAPDFRLGRTDQDPSELSSLNLHAEQTLDNFDLRQGELPGDATANLQRALALAQAFAEQPRDWIVFTGPYGCGKTHLAAAIANFQARQGRPALFVVVPDLLDHLRAAFNPATPVAFDKRFEEVRRAPLLILDDLGTESATPWAREKLYQLFNYRYNARLSTVVTTAIPIEELDPRLVSRILDKNRCTVFGITAPAYRGGSVHKSRPATRRRTKGARG